MMENTPPLGADFLWRVRRTSGEAGVGEGDRGVKCRPAMFDWTAAENLLFHISTRQVAQFLAGPDKDDVYGFGFFCDALTGVCFVANTEPFHLASLRDFESRFGPTEPEIFRWEIGNWKYPAGLFPSSNPEQREFDDGWRENRKTLAAIAENATQTMLEKVCVNVLRRLTQDGAFSAAPGIKGFMVPSPDDPREVVMAKKKLLDTLIG
jgi:hypothetical protein